MMSTPPIRVVFVNSARPLMCAPSYAGVADHRMSPGRPSAAGSHWTADADGGSAPPPGCAAAPAREGSHALLLKPSELFVANDTPPFLSVGTPPTSLLPLRKCLD